MRLLYKMMYCNRKNSGCSYVDIELISFIHLHGIPQKGADADSAYLESIQHIEADIVLPSFCKQQYLRHCNFF